MLEKQDSELKQAKQIIPTLQKQVTTLTGQLHSLAEDLAEVWINVMFFTMTYIYVNPWEALQGEPET